MENLPVKDHKISFGEAIEYEDRYISSREVSEEKPKSHKFRIDQVKELVNNEEAEFFVVNNAIDKDGKQNIVLSVIDEDGCVAGSFALQGSYPCPPYCN